MGAAFCVSGLDVDEIHVLAKPRPEPDPRGSSSTRRLTLFPVLLHLGPLTLPSYPCLLNLGWVLGATIFIVLGRRRSLQSRTLVDLLLAAAVGGLILGRAGYVAVHWDYYVDHHHLREALRLWRGGLLWQGALMGAIGGAAGVCAVRAVRLLPMLDLLTPSGAVLGAFAWLACLAVGSAWGIETYPGQPLLWLLSLDLPDLYGIRQPRVAVQLIGAVWSAVTLGVVLLLRTRLRRDSSLFAMWLILQGVGALGLGFLRGDPMPLVAGWRLGQLANGVLSIVGALLLGARQIAALGERRR